MEKSTAILCKDQLINWDHLASVKGVDSNMYAVSWLATGCRLGLGAGPLKQLAEYTNFIEVKLQRGDAVTDAEKEFLNLSEEEKEMKAARLLHDTLTKKRKQSYDYYQQLSDLLCAKPYGDKVTDEDRENNVGVLPQEGGWKLKQTRPMHAGAYTASTGANRSQLSSKSGPATIKSESMDH
jgi:hypothetical protein